MPFSKLMYLAAELCLSKILLFCPLFSLGIFSNATYLISKMFETITSCKKLSPSMVIWVNWECVWGRSIAEAFKSV